MKVKNVSTRLHHVGSVSIAPGAVADIPDAYKNSINKNDLVEVKAPAPAAPGSPAAQKAAAVKAAEKVLADAKTAGDPAAITAAEDALAAAKA